MIQAAAHTAVAVVEMQTAVLRVAVDIGAAASAVAG